MDVEDSETVESSTGSPQLSDPAQLKETCPWLDILTVDVPQQMDSSGPSNRKENFRHLSSDGPASDENNYSKDAEYVDFSQFISTPLPTATYPESNSERGSNSDNEASITADAINRDVLANEARRQLKKTAKPIGNRMQETSGTDSSYPSDS